MAVLRFVILLFAALAIVQGFPAEKTTSVKDEVEFVPLGKQSKGKEGSPIIDLDAGNDFDISNSQFSKFFGNLQSVIASMSNRINTMFNQLPQNYNGNVVIPLPDFPVPGLGNLDLGKANTTSVTKIIDGHKVTINDTDYRNENNNETAFFHVRVVDVHPNENGFPSKQVIEQINNEFVKDSKSENDIFKNEGEEVFTINGNVKVNPFAPLKIQKRKDTEWSEEWGDPQPFDDNDLQNIETFVEDDSGKKEIINGNFNVQPFRDLSNDIYVNDILANSGAPTDPDAEVFDVNGKFSSLPNARYSIIKPDPITNDITSKKSYYFYNSQAAPHPIDLHNDIYVNEILASRGATVNPNAEVFDVRNKGSPKSFRNP